jgi:hypothetical protein
MQDHLTRLRDVAARHAGGRRVETAVPRLTISQAVEATRPQSGLLQPMLCLILQGTKEVMIGERLLRYDPASYFIATLDLPASARIVEASVERPYIAVSLALDSEGLAALVPGVPARSEVEVATAAFAVSPVTPQLLDAWLRFLGLLDAPEDIAVLAPFSNGKSSTACCRGRRAWCSATSPAPTVGFPASAKRSRG